MNPRVLRHIFSYLFIGAIGYAAIWLVTHQQYVIDQVSALQYQPSSQVATIATRDTLTPAGKFIFYASQPAIEDAAAFNSNCVNTEQGSAILGCYVGNRIYVYNVTTPELQGIQEVTAAHEMLHAVYQRMDDAERTKINALLEDTYTKLKNNPDFADRMAIYAKTEPGERDNELHSIIGTEVASLSPELEAHYKKYFENRQAIVTMHDTYNAQFERLAAEKTSLANQLSSLNSKITSETEKYNNDAAALNTDIDSFNKQANAGSFSSQAEFSQARAQLVSRISALDTLRTAVNADIATYQSLYAQYQSVIGKANSLTQSIDSKLAPAPSL